MTEITSSTTTDTATAGSPSELDLAFIIDATGSMGSYIHSAQTNMKKIIHDLITSEKCLLNVALILYRDHPPQDSSFIIQVYDFTDDPETAEKNIDLASASGGGDGPEAVAPALHAAVHSLKWRKNAVKIALLIADAPPHGLETAGDGFPDGDPSGHDPMESVAELAENAVTLYTIGCEPAATPYRDFYMALAFKTGGQYIPLASSSNLASVIVGSTREEISLERLIAKVHEEVMQEAASRGGPVDEAELTRRIHELMKDGGAKARRVTMNNERGENTIPALTKAAEHLSTLKTLQEVRKEWVRFVDPTGGATGTLFGAPFGTTAARGLGIRGRGKATRAMKIKAPRAVTPKKKAEKKPSVVLKRTASIKRKATSPAAKAPAKKKVRTTSAHGSRRSARLAFSKNETKDEEEEEEEEVVSTDSEPMDTAATTTPPPPPAKRTPKKRATRGRAAKSAPKATPKKPAELKTAVSNVHLEEDELLDISQTRRLVRKCVARSKLK